MVPKVAMEVRARLLNWTSLRAHPKEAATLALTPSGSCRASLNQDHKRHRYSSLCMREQRESIHWNSYVPFLKAPKSKAKVLLAADAGKGLEIRGAFARRGGSGVILALTLINHTNSPMHGFMIQLNKNLYLSLPLKNIYTHTRTVYTLLLYIFHTAFTHTHTLLHYYTLSHNQTTCLTIVLSVVCVLTLQLSFEACKNVGRCGAGSSWKFGGHNRHLIRWWRWGKQDDDNATLFIIFVYTATLLYYIIFLNFSATSFLTLDCIFIVVGTGPCVSHDPRGSEE